MRARRGGETLCESVMTGQLQGSLGTCHVNRARLASLTTFLHHDDDRRIACVCQAKSLVTWRAWVGGIETAQRPLVGIRPSNNLDSSSIHLRLAAFRVLGRTYIRDSAAAAASAMITCIFILHGKGTETAAITVVTGYFSTGSRHPRRTACLNSIDYQGLKSRSRDVLKVAGT